MENVSHCYFWCTDISVHSLKNTFVLSPKTGSLVSTVDVDQSMDKESPEYLEALAQATEELEFCVNLCKSHVMMVTCFDISMPSTPGTQEGLREVEV